MIFFIARENVFFGTLRYRTNLSFKPFPSAIKVQWTGGACYHKRAPTRWYFSSPG